jgi:tmRNA-binding protein
VPTRMYLKNRLIKCELAVGEGQEALRQA